MFSLQVIERVQSNVCIVLFKANSTPSSKSQFSKIGVHK